MYKLSLYLGTNMYLNIMIICIKYNVQAVIILRYQYVPKYNDCLC